jgi:sensor histidine kinase YesM
MQLVRDEPAQAERALEQLADLLRYVLRLDRVRARTVSLEAEWQFVQNYLWLERMRLGERLIVQTALDDDALTCQVPPFTLQPLVENAVRHGLAPRDTVGTLTIRAEQADDRLHLEVADDGVGAASAPDGESTGIGLSAVVRRARAIFGTDAVQMSVTTAPGAGFCVQLSLPALVENAPIGAMRESGP